MSDPAVAAHLLTIDDFIVFMDDRPKGERWYLDDGIPVMNPLPTRRHDWIQTNIVLALRSHWARHRPAWQPAGPSQVPVPGFRRTVAPDVLVSPVLDRDDVYLTPDPIVVFEILSKSDTRARRVRKLADYGAIASIRHYVVVRQDRRHVTAYHRDPEGLLVGDVADQSVALAAIGVTLTLAEIYAATSLAD